MYVLPMEARCEASSHGTRSARNTGLENVSHQASKKNAERVKKPRRILITLEKEINDLEENMSILSRIAITVPCFEFLDRLDNEIHEPLSYSNT